MEFKNPFESLQQKGRAYMTKGKYPRIHVFSKSVTELDRLEREFGGNHYQHGSGYIWVFSGEKAIKDLLAAMEEKGYLPTVHGIEKKLGG